MDPDLRAFARRHGLDDEAARELEGLWAAREAAVSTLSDVFATFSPDSLASDGSDEPDGSDGSDDGPARSELLAERYQDLGALGTGGMGEVRRVRDVVLGRVLAMKLVHAPLVDSPHAGARFLEEAQATAQLQHPNIVPVHDMGRLPDGRLWFTMKEVRGRTLREVIEEVHAASRERWEPGPSGWTLRRLVSAFQAVCHAVAYAHERGVVHRDLKPDNVMVGDHGEVYVLDWGLARVLGPSARPPEETVATARSAAGSRYTRFGQVTGTPAYMPPEQARGAADAVDERSDVYALGAILYELLSGRPPYVGPAAKVVRQVLSGPPAPPGRQGAAAPPLPGELVDVCVRAMARAASDRFPTVSALAEEVTAWLEGVRRRARARAVVERALSGEAEAEALAARAASLRREAEHLLSDVAPWQPEDDKAPGWARQAEAERAEARARRRQLEVDQGLHAALQIAPELPEAHAALADRYRARHAEAEADRDASATSEAALHLELHADALPATHPVRREVAAYLAGDGLLTLVTDPPGAEVLLYRYVEVNRRLVEVAERSLGPTPLREVPLPMGSWLCVLRHPDRAEVRYPVEITRRGHWDGRPPGASEPAPVWLPPRGWLGDDEIYVPAGWFRAGGARPGVTLPATRYWCDGFVMHRHPVTNRQYLAFLDDLVARGRAEEALRHAPRERAGREGEQGAMIYAFDGSRFALQPDAQGDVWQPDWAVTMVDRFGAQAWLAWWAARTGRPWRLPGELEWERAARGVDGRRYPWGDHLDPSWCRMGDSRPGRRLPTVVDSYPVDTSPFGVRGLAGNVQDWCLDAFHEGPAVVERRVVPPTGDGAEGLGVVRGGSWTSHASNASADLRFRNVCTVRFPFLGFRGLFPLEPGPL